MAQAYEDEAIKADIFATTEIIKVYIGSEKRQFNIHKKLLCKYSGFFEKCINNRNFREGSLGEVNLPDDETSPFQLIVNWLYRFDPVPPKSQSSEIIYAKAYLLADRLIMPHCKDDILDAIREYHNDTFVGAHTFEQLPTAILASDLPARSYYRDQFAYDLAHNPKAFLCKRDLTLGPEERSMFESGGQEMVVIWETALQYLALGPLAEDPSVAVCAYHSHDEDKPYPSCMMEG